MGLGVISALHRAGTVPGDRGAVTCNQFGESLNAMEDGRHSGSNERSPVDHAILAIRTAVRVANDIDVRSLHGIETPRMRPDTLEGFEHPTREAGRRLARAGAGAVGCPPVLMRAVPCHSGRGARLCRTATRPWAPVRARRPKARTGGFRLQIPGNMAGSQRATRARRRKIGP